MLTSSPSYRYELTRGTKSWEEQKMKPALFCTDNGKGLFTDNEKGLNEF